MPAVPGVILPGSGTGFLLRAFIGADIRDFHGEALPPRRSGTDPKAARRDYTALS